jgi:hypothetical protein
MAITSIDGVFAGLVPGNSFYKDPVGSILNTGYWVSCFYNDGYPVAAAPFAPGMPGEALTSYTGQFPFQNPSSGNTYLASVSRLYKNESAPNSRVSLMLVDRLWHNSGIVSGDTGLQIVNSVTWPARDLDGTANGRGVYIAVEVSGGTGAASGAVNFTMTYTNSSGVSGRSSANVNLYGSGILVRGTWIPIGLDAGDVGVRSIQDITLSTTSLAIFRLVAYRPVAIVNPFGGQNNSSIDDALTLAMPRLHDNTVLQSVSISVDSSSSDGGSYIIQYTQG